MFCRSTYKFKIILRPHVRKNRLNRMIKKLNCKSWYNATVQFVDLLSKQRNLLTGHVKSKQKPKLFNYSQRRRYKVHVGQGSYKTQRIARVIRSIRSIGCYSFYRFRRRIRYRIRDTRRHYRNYSRVTLFSASSWCLLIMPKIAVIGSSVNFRHHTEPPQSQTSFSSRFTLLLPIWLRCQKNQ